MRAFIRSSAAAVVSLSLAAGLAVGPASAAHHHVVHHRRARHQTAVALHHTGQTVTLKAKGGRLRLRLVKVAGETQLRNQSDVDYSQYAPPGHEFVVVTLQLTALGAGVPASHLRLFLLGANKAHYAVNSAAGVALGADNYPSTLAKGKTIRESEAFVVPTPAGSLVLQVTLEPGGKPARFAAAVK